MNNFTDSFSPKTKNANVMVKIDSIVSTSTTKKNFHEMLLKTLQKTFALKTLESLLFTGFYKTKMLDF